jgi:hypothetical protein
MMTISIDENTIQELKEVAERKGKTLQAVTEEAVQNFLLEQKRETIRKESAAFQKMHPKLLREYEGQYVAIYQGEVVDSDSEQLPLYQRVAQKYPGETFLLKKVTSSPEEVYTIRSPKISYR